MCARVCKMHIKEDVQNESLSLKTSQRSSCRVNREVSGMTYKRTISWVNCYALIFIIKIVFKRNCVATLYCNKSGTYFVDRFAQPAIPGFLGL